MAESKLEPAVKTKELDFLINPAAAKDKRAEPHGLARREMLQKTKPLIVDILKKDFKNGRDFSCNSLDSKGTQSFLTHLIQNGLTVSARNLLQAENIDLTFQDPEYQATPLHWAAYKGNYLLLQALLNRISPMKDGIKWINSHEKSGDTPLIEAIQACNLSAIKLLLAAGADPKIKASRNTALSEAIKMAEEESTKAGKIARTKIVQFLETYEKLSSKRPESKDKSKKPILSPQETFLRFGLINPEKTEDEQRKWQNIQEEIYLAETAEKMLGEQLIAAVKHGEDVFFEPLHTARELLEKQNTLLQEAKTEQDKKKAQRNIDAANEVLKQFAKATTYVNDHDKTAWDCSVEEGNMTAMIELINLDANVNRQDMYLTTLHLIVKSDQNIEAIKTLFSLQVQAALKKKGKFIDLNIRNSLGNTSLACAACPGQIQMVTELLAQGADPSIQNNRGKTALTLLEESTLAPKIKTQITKLLTQTAPSDEKQASARRSKELLQLIKLPLEIAPTNISPRVKELYGELRVPKLQKIKALIAQGIDPYFTEDFQGSFLIYFILQDHISCIREILKVAPDLIEHGDSTSSSSNALAWAAYKGNPEVVRILLDVLRKNMKLASTINATGNTTGTTALVEAILGNNSSAAKLLIAEGADFRKIKYNGITAYELAKNNRQNELVAFMEEFEAAGEKTDALPDEKSTQHFKPTSKQQVLTWGMFSDDLPENPETASLLREEKQDQRFRQQCRERRSQQLINAIKDGDQENITLLLGLDVDLLYVDCNGFGILHHAIMMDYEALVTQLLQNPDIDINAQTPISQGFDGLTPLQLTAEHDRPRMTAALLKAGAALTIKNQAGLTPLETVKENLPILLAHNRSQNPADLIQQAEIEALNLLHHAAKIDHQPTILQLIAQRRVDINKQDHQGNTAVSIAAAEQKQVTRTPKALNPLFHAAKMGDDKTIRDLKPSIAELETQDKYGYTPLHWAAQNGHTTTVKLLLELGANIKAEDSAGFTPLACAALHGQLPLVQVLIRKGASIHFEDAHGKKLEDIAMGSTKTFFEDTIKVTLLHSRYLADKLIQNPTWAAPKETLDLDTVSSRLKKHENNVIKALIEDLGNPSPANNNELIARLTGFSDAFEKVDSTAATTVREIVRELTMPSKKQPVTESKTENPFKDARLDFLREGVRINQQLRGEARLERYQQAKDLLKTLREDPTFLSPNSQDTEGYTILSSLIWNGFSSLAQQFLSLNEDLNLAFRDKSQSTPLHWAAYWGDYLVTENLLCRINDNQQSDLINIQDEFCNTPLINAALNGHLNLVMLLIAHGANPNITNNKGNSPLKIAEIGKHKHVVTFLQKFNSAKSSKPSVLESKKLASQETEEMRVAQALISAIQTPDNKQFKAILNDEKHAASLQAILTCKDEHTKTIWDYAVEYGNIEAMRLLMACQETFHTYRNAQDLIAIVKSGDNEKLEDYLKELKKTGKIQDIINCANIQDKTAWEHAAKEENVDAMILLMQYGADAHRLKPTLNQQTCLHYADEETIETIFSERIQSRLTSTLEIDKQTTLGNTPLGIAASNGNTGAVNALLKFGANIEAPNSHGDTHLAIAAKMGHQDTVMALLLAGANIGAKNSLGQRPRDLANASEHHDIVKYFDEFMRETVYFECDNRTKSASECAAPLESKHSTAPVEKKASRIPPSMIAHARKARAKKLIALLAHEKVAVVDEEIFGHPRQQHIQAAKKQINQGINWGVSDEKGHKPLTYLILNNYSSLIRQALDSSPNAASLTGSDGKSALHWAAFKGNPDVMRMVISALQNTHQLSALIHTKDSSQATPLMLALQTGNEEVAKLLIIAGADLSSARNLALSLKKNDLVKFMDDFGVADAKTGLTPKQRDLTRGMLDDVDDEELEGLTSKQRQIYGQNIKRNISQKIINRLKDGNEAEIADLEDKLSFFDIDYQDCFKQTILHYAVMRGHSKLVDTLLREHKANIQQQNHTGHTSLHMAIIYNHSATIRILLEHGASLTAKNHAGQTPLDLARLHSISGEFLIRQAMTKQKTEKREAKSDNGSPAVAGMYSRSHLQNTSTFETSRSEDSRSNTYGHVGIANDKL